MTPATDSPNGGIATNREAAGVHAESMQTIPYVLEPMAEDRRQLFTILDLLEKNEDHVVRADLASELVGTCSRYEDVKERVVYPALARLIDDEGELQQGEDDRQAVRDALLAIRKQTLHVKPAYVHLDDPDFDDTLNHLVELIHAHVDHEDEVLFPALAALNAEERVSLRSEVERGVAHASTYPNPPRHLLGRAIVAVIEKLERGLDDESTPWHPGIELLDEALSSGAPGGAAGVANGQDR
jgi:hemerythrin-like domain-containing protein